MEECRALTQLKEDTSRVVLTADMGVAMFIMDKQDYTNKALSLWQIPAPTGSLTKTPPSNLKRNSYRLSRA